MAQPAGLIRTVWNFSLQASGVPEETAQLGIVWEPSVAVDDAVAPAVLAEMAIGAYAAWKSDIATEHYETAIVLETVTARLESTAGAALFQEVATVADADKWKGTGTAGSLPWQVSMVISLYTYTPSTFIPNGRRRRGRVYLPPYGTSVLNDGDTGEVSTSFCTDRMNEFATMLADIQSHSYVSLSGLAPVPGVLSRTADHLYPITDLRVNTKLDTQRRRTKKLLQTWVTGPYSP